MILLDRHGKNNKLKRRLHSLATDGTTVKTHDGPELTADALTDCELFVCYSSSSSSSCNLHSEQDYTILREFLDRGGSVAIFSTKAESKLLNDFLSNYDIQIEDGTVVRAVYHENYLHPQQALIQNGIVQPFDATAEQQSHDAEDMSTSMAFLYPNGTTLSVDSPAFTLLSSGSTSYPVDCPIAAAWEATTESASGRLIVVGSADIFADEWLEREDNAQLCDVLFKFLLHQTDYDPSLGRSDFEEKECVPDIASLSNLIKPCLKDLDPLPKDYKTLLCDDQFGLTMDHIPKVIDLHKTLNVPYEPLTLIEPHLNCPHPPLIMATHAPKMPEPPAPELELFDLDECGYYLE